MTSRTPLVIALLLGCGPGALVYQHPQTGAVIRCDGGGAFAAWEREQRRNLCVQSALASGYQLIPDEQPSKAAPPQWRKP